MIDFLQENLLACVTVFHYFLANSFSFSIFFPEIPILYLLYCQLCLIILFFILLYLFPCSIFCMIFSFTDFIDLILTYIFFIL